MKREYYISTSDSSTVSFLKSNQLYMYDPGYGVYLVTDRGALLSYSNLELFEKSSKLYGHEMRKANEIDLLLWGIETHYD